MDAVVQQCTDLIDRTYREGHALQQRCNEQEAAIKAERGQAKAWLEQTQKDLQQQSEDPFGMGESSANIESKENEPEAKVSRKVCFMKLV